MAEPYLTRLAQIVAEIGPLPSGGATLESKHFFSGAALYVNGKIFASLSPAGFAVKFPEDTRISLIEDGKGTEFRLFAKGPVKREYIALSDSVIADDGLIRELIALSAGYVLDILDQKKAAGR